MMGKDYLSIFNLLPSTKDQRSSVKTCLDSLQEHFKPNVNAVYERYLFNSAMQNSGEKIDYFVHRLRELWKSCEYGMLCDDLVRDRMVLGKSDNDFETEDVSRKSFDVGQGNFSGTIIRNFEAVDEENKNPNRYPVRL